MNYKQYFLKCRESYAQSSKPTLAQFYDNPVILIPDKILTDEYHKTVAEVAKEIKKEFDLAPTRGTMKECGDLWKYHEYLSSLANFIVPFLEEERYGCNLYVDKVYIYRTLKVEKRVSSYLWHYDNNPLEIVKNIIYLNDVTDKNSPFEFMSDKTALV